METNKKTLRFRIGEESLPLILNDEERKTSPFDYAIGNAIKCLENKIAVSAQSVVQSDAKATNDNSGYPDNWEYRTPNNIITFLGDRGSGKTSCMRSVVNICRGRHEDWLFTDEIDPSFFDETHNILEILVGELYGKFCTSLEEWDSLTRKKQDELRKIQDKFRKVKSAFRYFDSKELVDGIESETDGLMYLNEGGKLRSLLNELISGILKYHGKKMLVISIDDLDLNIRHSYVMMEKIRKYLILPQVGIIIAARYTQLFDSVCLVLTQHYEIIHNRVSHKDISEMAERYLTKMFPLDQRFDMPSPESILDSVLIIEDENGKPINSDENATVTDKIPAMIFDRSRFLFYNSVGMPSLVIPRNLRDLRMLVGMLYNMNPYDESQDGAQNQSQFISYFNQEWIGTLDPEYRELAEALIQEEDPAKINRFVVKKLYIYFLKDSIRYHELNDYTNAHSDSYIKEHSLLYDILNPENSYWNISVGDVVAMMNYVRKLHDSDKSQRLLFFIETFYSITLYRLYNRLTDLTTEQGLNQELENPTSSPMLKTSVRAEIPEYFRFVGGSFFSSTGDSFIPASSGEKDVRERRLINGRLLMDEIRRVVEEYNKLEDNVSDIPEQLTARLRLCEFFMLTTKGRTDLKAPKDIWRLTNEPLYFKSFVYGTKNLIFDVTSPFFNSIYPKYCYDRFNDKIFAIAQKDSGSLLNSMTRCGNRDKQNMTWELMSKAAIRNMEILTDITSYMLNRRDSLRPRGNDLLGYISDFYKSFDTGNYTEYELPSKGYWVKTYHRIPKDNQRPYYIIDYTIFHLLGDVADHILDSAIDGNGEGTDKTELDIFNAIMQENMLFEDKNQFLAEDVWKTLTKYCKNVDTNLLSKNIKSSYVSLDTLARLLAVIRISYRYDFTDRIGEQLQAKYEEYVRTEEVNRRKALMDDLHNINKEIENFDSDYRSATLAVDGLNNKIAQFNEQKSNAEKELKQLSDQKEKEEQVVAILKDKEKPDGLSVAELEKLEEDLNKAEVGLASLTNKMNDADKRIKDLDKEIAGAQNHVNELRNQQRSLTQKMKNRERKRLEFMVRWQDFESNMKNPLPVSH